MGESGNASRARTSVGDRRYAPETVELAERAEVHEISQGLEICGDESAYSTNEQDTNTIPPGGREGSFGRLPPTGHIASGSGTLQGKLVLNPRESDERAPKQRREIATRVRVDQVGTLSSRADRIDAVLGCR